jgi:hypothetical protein
VERLEELKRYVLNLSIIIPVNIRDLKDDSWVSLQYGKRRGIAHLNFTFSFEINRVCRMGKS